MKAKKNNVALTRTSAFREDRKNYLTEDGYTYWRWDEDLKKEVPVHIIVENSIPTIDYDGAKREMYTHKEGDGRYGLLIGYTE